MASLDQLPSTYVHTIIIPIKLFRFIGVDYFDDRARIRNYCKFFMHNILSFSFIIGTVLFLFKRKELDASILEIADAIPNLALAIQSLSKFMLIHNKKNSLRRLVYDLAELWPGDDLSQDKKELMDRWLRRNRTACEFVVKLTLIGVILFDMMPLVLYFAMRLFNGNPDFMLPFTVWYPFEIDSVWKYLLVYLTQFLSTALMYESCYLPCDIFLFTLCFDISMLLRLVEHDLVNMNVERRGQGAEECLENLKNIVKRHQKILKICEKLNDIFGNIVFTVLLFSSLIICFYGFLGIVVTENFRKFLSLLAMVEILFSVFYIMLPGQTLSNTSSGVAFAAYESLWYNSDVRFKKMLVIIIARSQKPCRIRAVGYADANFETFYKICGTTWSYLSVVNQMYQNLT